MNCLAANSALNDLKKNWVMQQRHALFVASCLL